MVRAEVRERSLAAPHGVALRLRGNLRERISLAGYGYDEPEVLFAEHFETILIGHAILSSYAITFDGRGQRVHFALSR